MRIVIAIGFVLVSTFPLFAAEAESKLPYTWRIVVQSPVHPSLTPPVRERVCKDLKAALLPILGEELGRIEVVDLRATPEKNWEPLWKAFVEGGWPALEKEDARKLTGIKTHFVKLEVRDGRTFRVEARQLDGSTGIVSPVIRSTETQNADTIARLAGLIVGKDFGPIGTVEAIKDNDKQVSVKFRGGQLPGFDRTVETGDILAFGLVMELPRPGGNRSKIDVPVQLAGKPQSTTYLRIASKISNGECRCDLLSGSANSPLVAAKNIAGYRAMKVATQESMVRLRLLDPEGKSPPSTTSLEVWATDLAFTGKSTNRDTLDLQKGLYSSGRPLKNVAFVVVRVGATKSARFVVPLVPGTEPITVRIVIDQTDIEKAEYEQLCERLRGRVADAGAAQMELFKALGALIVSTQYDAAMARATGGAKATETADLILSDELAKLKKHKLVKETYAASLLAVSEQQLQILRSGKPELEKKIEDLKMAIAKSNDPVKFEKEFRANELVRQIQYHVGRGEVPEAEPLYDQLIELTKQDEMKAKKAKLLADWATANDEHRKARAFLLDEWRKAATLAEYQPLLQKLAPTAEVFVKNADKLGLRNLLGAIGISYAKLLEQLATLDENSDRDLAKELKAFGEKLRKIEQAVEAESKKLEEKK